MESRSTGSRSKSAVLAKTSGIRTTVIRQKEFVPAKPTDIYDAFLNEARHSAFTGAPATCERWVGGKFTAWDGYIVGTNVKLENGRRIVQEWMTTEWPDGCPPSILEITLKPKGAGTEIHLVQTNVPASQAKQYRQEWVEYYFAPLKKYFGKK